MGQSKPGPWQKEFDDFLRAFSGAFLFGMPLLYTMEMWWLGQRTSPLLLLALIAVALAATFGLTRFAGFKRESTFRGNLADTIDVVAVAVVASTLVLLVLNQISPSEPLVSLLGKIVVQTVPLSIGASIANALFSPDKARQGEQSQRGPWRAVIADIGPTAIGAAFIGFSIAPTDEIPMLAAGLDFVHLLALICFSLLLTYVIVFESGLNRQDNPRQGVSHGAVSETFMAYVVSLVVAFAALALYNRPDFNGPLGSLLTQVLVLGLPSAIGGAAGRLVYE